MANKTIDLRTYLALEKAFLRRLQRSWRIQSAPTYAAITQACLDHKWDEARRLVPDLDMAEVGTENKEWITYMLLSCGVFGANLVARGKPSFVGVGSFDSFLKQTTNNILQYLEYNATAQVQAEALQSIAEDEAKTKAAMLKVAWDESKHPRDKEGQFAHSGTARQPGEEEGSDLEGGGLERKKWGDLNVKAADANTAFIVARDAQYKVPVYHPDYAKLTTTREAAETAMRAAYAALDAQTSLMKIEVVTNLAHAEAKRMGVDPSAISVIDREPHKFMVGNQQFNEGGHYDPTTRHIELNVHNLNYTDASAIKGIVTHELTHLVHHTLHEAGSEEYERYLAKALTKKVKGGEPVYSAWFHKRFEVDPDTFEQQVRPTFQAELAKEFPASVVLSGLAGGPVHMFDNISESMIKENGHSEYAKSYWTHEAIKDKGGYQSAINETLAEVTRFLHHPSSWDEPTTPDLNSPWVKLTSAMHTWYRAREAQKQGWARYHPPDAKGRKYGEPGYNT